MSRKISKAAKKQMAGKSLFGNTCPWAR